MNDPSNDNKILIKFEIQIPMSNGQPAVVVQQAGTQPQAIAPPPQVTPQTPIRPGIATPSQGKQPERVLGVDLPAGTAYVKVTTNSQTICVTKDGDSHAILGVPDDVYLKIQPPSEPLPGPVSVFDTPDGVGAIPLGVGDSFYQWHHPAVPEAMCASPSTGGELPWNRLIVWRKYGFWPFWTRESISFQGECSDQTDCDYYRQPHQTNAASQVIDTAPVGLRVDVHGFGGALCGLNGKWLLVRSASAGHSAKWSCGGDGIQHPRIELAADSCGCEPLQLRLSCGGMHVTYLAPRGEFNPLGQNRFTWCGDRSGLVGCDIPTALNVVPA